LTQVYRFAVIDNAPLDALVTRCNQYSVSGEGARSYSSRHLFECPDGATCSGATLNGDPCWTGAGTSHTSTGTIYVECGSTSTFDYTHPDYLDQDSAGGFGYDSITVSY
jgi:hypothetical protein